MVRDASRQSRKDSIYPAAKPGASTFPRERAESVARELARGSLRPEPGGVKNVRTRRDVLRGWCAFAEAMEREGLRDIAFQVRQFSGRMPEVRTDHEEICLELLRRVRPKINELPPPMRDGS